MQLITMVIQLLQHWLLPTLQAL